MARKEKKHHFIYKTTNNLNGRYYIGMHSTDNINDGYMGSGKRLRRSLNKHGKENHSVEILEFLPDRKSLIAREKEVVNANEIAKQECMNLMIGGKGGFVSEEQQRRRSIIAGRKFAEKLLNNSDLMKSHGEEFSRRLRRAHSDGKIRYDTFTGRHHSEITKEKMRLQKKGVNVGCANSQFGTCWITKNDMNKKVHLDCLNEYIQNGWTRGRKMK